jgi:hypothetical protein
MKKANGVVAATSTTQGVKERSTSLNFYRVNFLIGDHSYIFSDSKR